MAWRRPGAKPLSDQCWNIANWTPRNKHKWNLNQNWYIFIQENAFENVVRNFCLGDPLYYGRPAEAALRLGYE